MNYWTKNKCWHLLIRLIRPPSTQIIYEPVVTDDGVARNGRNGFGRHSRNDLRMGRNG